MPSVTGYYSLKAVYEENLTYYAVSAIVNFVVESFEDENVFSVNSNSTLTDFSFDSNSRKLSFGVSGDSGTTGYINIIIPKALVNDVSTFRVYLDGNQTDYSYQSVGDGWLLYFTYNHSSHSVEVNLGSSSTEVSGLGSVEIAVIAIMSILATVAILAAFTINRRKTSNP